MIFKENENNLNYKVSQSSKYSPLAVGYRIKLVRKELGLSQKELGTMLGVSGSYISCIETGKRQLTHQITLPLLRALNISYEYLTTGSYYRDLSPVSALCESSAYLERLKLEKLIQNCTKSEYEMCYQLCSTYLNTSRRSNKSSPAGSKDSDSKSLSSNREDDHISESDQNT